MHELCHSSVRTWNYQEVMGSRPNGNQARQTGVGHSAKGCQIGQGRADKTVGHEGIKVRILHWMC